MAAFLIHLVADICIAQNIETKSNICKIEMNVIFKIIFEGGVTSTFQMFYKPSSKSIIVATFFLSLYNLIRLN